MSNNGLADSCIDTGFIQNGLYVALHYQYKNDRNYTPCYSEPASDKVTRTINTTIYEYNMK